MQGAYPIGSAGRIIPKDLPGVYILSRDGVGADYVGRSDTDLRVRTVGSARQGRYRFFWFECATSPMQAYRLECRWFHRYQPPDNAVHPAVPPGADWRCPVPGCPWSSEVSHVG